MATTYNDNGGAVNGSNLEYTFSFAYLKTEDVKVSLNGSTQATTKYAVTTSPTKITFNNTNVDSTVQESTGAPKTGVTVRVYRDTDVDTAKAVYASGSSIRAVDLNNNQDQVLYALQEEQTQRGLAVTTTVQGEMSAADKVKLDAIEASATADQTNAEIRAAVEAATDSNVFTDADHTKLNAIEASATADQTDAEIRAAVEAASDSNVFTDADHSKLNAIEASADVTDATNVNAAGAVMNSDLDGKGELLVGDGSGDPSALAVGTNGYILTADSTESTGMKWAANAGSGSSGGNDITVIDESTTLTTAATKFTFAGAGVTATEPSTDEITVTIPGGSTFTTITEDGSGDITFDATKTGGTGDNIVWDKSEAAFECGSDVIFKVGTGRIYEIDDAGETWDGDIVFGNFAANNDVYISSYNAVKIGTNANTTDDHVAYFKTPIGGASEDGYVKLYYTPHAGSPSNRIETTSTGTTLFKDVFFDNSTNAGKDILWDESDDALEFADDVKATFGTGGDLELYHNATDSYIDNDTGNLYIRNNVASDVGGDIYIRPHDNEEGIKIIHDGGVEIYHNNVKKLETTATGATVTGTVAATAFTGDGSALTGISAGTALTGSTNNTLVTVTGANAIAGEAKLTFDGTVLAVDGSQAGACVRSPIYENPKELAENHTLGANYNGMAAGPFTIASGKSLTIESGATFTVV